MSSPKVFTSFVLMFVLVIPMLSACQAADVSSSFEPAAPMEINVTISGQTDGAPEGCTPEHVAGRLQSLFEAVNSADPDVVPEYFGTFDGDHTRANTGIAFQWFCMDTTTVYDLPELESYFIGRYQQNEQMRLRNVSLNGWEKTRSIVHFGLDVDRLADDLEGEWRTYTGKGAYYCKNQTFHVLCLGSGQ